MLGYIIPEPESGFANADHFASIFACLFDGMGNNKGRSKACKTCLRRRVKCGKSDAASKDTCETLHWLGFMVIFGSASWSYLGTRLLQREWSDSHDVLDQTHPTCTRCSKGNFTCLGYRETLFIDGQPQVQQRRHNQSILQLKKVYSPEALRTDRDCEDQLAKAPNSSQSQRELSPFQGLYSWSQLTASPWKEEVILSYLVADFGPMGTIYQKLKASQHEATKQCFLALATTFFGVGHAEASIVTEGRRLYCQALTTLNASISNRGCHRMIEILSSVVALSLHEVCQSFSSLIIC